MCLQTTWKRAKTAKEDIIVYKLFEQGSLTSSHQYFSYVANQLYETKMTTTEDNTSLDTQAGAEGARAQLEGIKFRSVEEGFHSAKYPSRFNNKADDVYDGDVVKCIIPKGSKYYEGFTDLLVSNKIIVTGEVVKTVKYDD